MQRPALLRLLSVWRLTALAGVVWFGAPDGLRAQDVAKPAVPGVPTAPPPAADTAKLATQQTPGGVRYVFHVRGTGPTAQPGSRVAVRYTGFLPDGHAFDATAASGGPLRFRVARGEVIPGWDELLQVLPAGSRVRAWIPAHMAYGAKGFTDLDNEQIFVIPPDTELVFELYVVSVR
ncbi:FKBP-type peptidyl-prolyl cis-trans isomerase [Hymenobacter sp. ASUV-10]|uniref:Peptidyl-prolyl cis-trans isomerase n=1 Tax=Hymenobacter aranciens TaxID=3063996 RepID=A0ABT9BFF8_9BACT|nr:FKBP-type peptidyl-prolyl cis-trans isomerase [Hymenobacter sp. ASUV-10]MDO7877010.1 FKBP-type peptidyl-prolyl cis-trans isomerase [Hymenobacter sp. ASUV-10]